MLFTCFLPHGLFVCILHFIHFSMWDVNDWNLSPCRFSSFPQWLGYSMSWRNISPLSSISILGWMDIHLVVIVVPLLICSINQILPFSYFFSGNPWCSIHMSSCVLLFSTDTRKIFFQHSGWWCWCKSSSCRYGDNIRHGLESTGNLREYRTLILFCNDFKY